MAPDATPKQSSNPRSETATRGLGVYVKKVSQVVRTVRIRRKHTYFCSGDGQAYTVRGQISIIELREETGR